MLDAIARLTVTVEQLSADCRALRVEQRKQVRAIWAALIGAVAVIGIVIAAAFTVTLSNSAQISENNQKICPVLALAIPKPGDPPPLTDRARLYVQRSTKLYKDFGCHE